jgi:hypothetical protein
MLKEITEAITADEVVFKNWSLVKSMNRFRSQAGLCTSCSEIGHLKLLIALIHLHISYCSVAALVG